jgi:hypothetical protein
MAKASLLQSHYPCLNTNSGMALPSLMCFSKGNAVAQLPGPDDGPDIRAVLHMIGSDTVMPRTVKHKILTGYVEVNRSTTNCYLHPIVHDARKTLQVWGIAIHSRAGVQVPSATVANQALRAALHF